PINPAWQRTDHPTLVRRYGRPAYDMVQRTDQVEQQMYQELRQRSSSAGVQRSDSAASYGSGSGLGVTTGGAGYGVTTGGGAGYGVSSSSFSQIPLGGIQDFSAEGIPPHDSS